MNKKTLLNSGLILLVIGVLYIIYLRECDGPSSTPDGYILVSQSDWDSMEIIANRPDIFIYGDTVFEKGPTVYLPGKPIPIPTVIGVDTNRYQDSIVNDSIDVTVDILVAGIILEWDWKYDPVIRTVENIIKTNVPVPFPVETPIYKREFFLSGVIGGNADAFTFGADLDLVNKKRNIYGFQYRRLGDENFYYFKIGTKLFKNR